MLAAYGSAKMVSVWFPCGSHMAPYGSPVVPYGLPVVSLWFPCGSLWFPYGFPMVYYFSINAVWIVSGFNMEAIGPLVIPMVSRWCP